MTHQVYHHSKALAASTSLLALPGAKLSFFLTTTTTPTDTYTTSARNVAHTNPVVADAAGVFPTIYLNPTIVYKVTYATAADVLVYTQDPVNDQILSQATIGGLLYPQTAEELSAGITPTYYFYEPGNVKRYGALGNGVADDSAAIQDAIDVGLTVTFPDGEYECNNLTQSVDFQRFLAVGFVTLQKNANGVHFNSTGDDVELSGIGFRGDASSPTFTGNGIVMSGENPRLINCGSRWCPGRAVLATGNHVQIRGSCDIYQTTDATGTGYDIEIGISGTATLYHRIDGIKSSQTTGGIKFIDCGGQVVQGSQFGKLSVAAGTSPAGSNGGHYLGNRILGAVTVDISSSTFASNTFSNIAITFAGGTSGHSMDSSNIHAVGATITDNSTLSVVEDASLVPYQTYTVTFTAAGGSPAVGNGTLVGYYSKAGRRVNGTIVFTIGGTTNAGTGAWFFSLPAIPNTSVSCLGPLLIFDNGTIFLTGVSKTLTDGTARIQGQSHSTVSAVGATVPITPAAGDVYTFGFDYFTS